MIVSCPGCSTQFTHGDEDTLRMARCSHCDERFAVGGQQRRRYMVMPAVEARPGDPLLGSGISDARASVDRPAAGAGGESRAAEQSLFGTGLDDETAPFGAEGPRSDWVEVAPDAAGNQAAIARPAHPVREALGVFLLAALGGIVGFHGSLRFDFEPLNAIGVGLGLGLTFGWAWIRWAERKR